MGADEAERDVVGIEDDAFEDLVAMCVVGGHGGEAPLANDAVVQREKAIEVVGARGVHLVGILLLARGDPSRIHVRFFRAPWRYLGQIVWTLASVCRL